MIEWRDKLTGGVYEVAKICPGQTEKGYLRVQLKDNYYENDNDCEYIPENEIFFTEKGE